MKDCWRAKQTEGFEEVFPIGTEEDMEKDFILMQLQKETREIDRRKNGQYWQVLEEEVKTSQ